MNGLEFDELMRVNEIITKLRERTATAGEMERIFGNSSKIWTEKLVGVREIYKKCRIFFCRRISEADL